MNTTPFTTGYHQPPLHFKALGPVASLFASMLLVPCLSSPGPCCLQERELKSGLSEVLKLTVAVPFLFGVPPQLEVLDIAIRTGGGIVDKVYQQWGMYRLPYRQSMYRARPVPADAREPPRDDIHRW